MAEDTRIDRLKKKLEKEKDPRVLEAIEILLRDGTTEDRINSRMTEIAIRSEEAMINGDVHPWHAVLEDIKLLIKEQSKRNSGQGDRI